MLEADTSCSLSRRDALFYQFHLVYHIIFTLIKSHQISVVALTEVDLAAVISALL